MTCQLLTHEISFRVWHLSLKHWVCCTRIQESCLDLNSPSFSLSLWMKFFYLLFFSWSGTSRVKRFYLKRFLVNEVDMFLCNTGSNHRRRSIKKVFLINLHNLKSVVESILVNCKLTNFLGFRYISLEKIWG